MSLFETLNPKQKQAVEHVNGPMLVLAGAGSGKTRVVTHRIARLIDIGTFPSDILAVTFTNKAADEMRSRIQTMKNVRVLTCTFHSLGARILRESIHLLGYSSDFTIYDEEDSLKLLKGCFQSIGVKDEKGTLKTIKHRISAAKNDLTLPDELSVNKQDKTDLLLQKVYPLYLARLKEANALDFDDLLFLTAHLLNKYEDAKHLYQNKWLFILIDEYQDTNYAQYTLTKILSAKHSNIFAVGDPDQSIYSWRGARYQNILNFDRDFPNSQIIKLEQNYRSTQNILQASNALITHNKERYEKDLWSQLEEGEKIKVYFARNDQEEADFVVKTIQTMCVEKQLSLNEIVIFYRTNAQSRSFEDAFLAKQLPYTIIGGISFYQRKEIKDLLAILKIIHSNSDFISFSRVVGFKKYGIGQTTLTHLIQASQNASIPILTLCKELCSKKTSVVKLNTKQLSSLKELLYLIESLKEQSGSIADLIKQVIDQFKYLDVLKQDPDSFEDRKGNIEELEAKAMQSEEHSLSEFLEEITLKAGHESQESEQSVKLMTVHNGKGLEFEMVFIIGLEEDLFPHASAKNALDQIEEERRLCYVAMTRAKKYLYLCGASYRFMWGSSRYMLPSRFIKELPSKYLENLSSIEETPTYQEEFKSYPFKKGERVVHHEFGSGVIQNMYETSYGPTYDIYFAKENITRSLVGKYAKLKKQN